MSETYVVTILTLRTSEDAEPTVISQQQYILNEPLEDILWGCECPMTDAAKGENCHMKRGEEITLYRYEENQKWKHGSDFDKIYARMMLGL